jgi:uncharacterized protein (TIGR02145 family)
MQKWMLSFFLLACSINIEAQTTYTFTGTGSWNTDTNWNGHTIPPGILPAGSAIVIDPVQGGNCILDITQSISAGAGFTIMPGAHCIIPGFLFIDSAGLPTVTIGNQVWARRNLDVATYRNGDTIPQVTDPAEFNGLYSGAWCYYNNDSANGAVFGKLYNWYAVNDPRGLAPARWHVATDVEWTELTTYLGGEMNAGAGLKATGIWNAPNTGATNSSGFTALPGGYRNRNGAFFDFYDFGLWWTATQRDGIAAYYWYLDKANTLCRRNSFNKGYGFSVRCVKD